MSDTRKSSVESSKAAEPVGPYPHARRVGDMLFLSGIGPRERGSKAIPGVTLNDKGEAVDHDIVMQTHSVMRNIKAVLEAAGASWDDIVDVAVYLTDMKRDFATFNTVYGEYFKGENRPTRTTVEVGALPTPIAVELKVVAYLGR
jgi:2-aminomuconate deaminase